MNAFEKLKTCAGEWRGTSRLHDPNTGQPEDTPSLLNVIPADNTVTLAYTWSYRGKPQNGELTICAEKEAPATAKWIDSWHTGSEGMTFAGMGNEEQLSLLGSFPAPPGPDWGWRIVLEPGDTLGVRMFNIAPEGPEDIAVECVYERSTG